MTAHTPKRPRDPAQLAKLIVDIATGEVEEEEPSATAIRARKGGSKGGPARAQTLTPEQRAEIARTAAAARWKKD
jgi:mono/diheme cytochrome c family protein